MGEEWVAQIPVSCRQGGYHHYKKRKEHCQADQGKRGQGYYLTNRHLHDTDKARQVLRTLFTLFNVVEVGKSDCEKALDSPVSDYDDALLACCAKHVKAEYIITRNIKDFQASPVPPITPDDFLTRFFPG